MNELLSGEAAYQATGDKSRRATTESIAGAFGSGLLQAPMMGAHGTAAGLAGHYGKKFIEGKKIELLVKYLIQPMKTSIS